MTEQQEVGIEQTKHRYRVREIWLDKGILAVLVAVVFAIANAELEDVRASHERLRVLTESEVAAHEATWTALMELRRYLAPLRESSLDEQSLVDLIAKVMDFSEKVDRQSIYLSDNLRVRLEEFVDPKLAEFVVDWQSNAPEPASAESWKAIDDEFESIGEVVRTEIYDRRVVAPDKRE